jgi:hypothetical protein
VYLQKNWSESSEKEYQPKVPKKILKKKIQIHNQNTAGTINCSKLHYLESQGKVYSETKNDNMLNMGVHFAFCKHSLQVPPSQSNVLHCSGVAK